MYVLFVSRVVRSKKAKKASVEEPKPEPTPELSEYWDEFKEHLGVPRMTDDDLRKFINDFLGNLIFSMAHMTEAEIKNNLGTVFVPIALGGFAKYNPDSLKQIGMIYEYYHKALPRGINGLPFFTSCRVMHIDDWKRAKKVIDAEVERRKSIELPKE